MQRIKRTLNIRRQILLNDVHRRLAHLATDERYEPILCRLPFQTRKRALSKGSSRSFFNEKRRYRAVAERGGFMARACREYES